MAPSDPTDTINDANTSGSDADARSHSVTIPAALLVVGLLLYLPWLGSYGPLDPTDSFFIESGREIFESNNYLLPMHNYRPWLDKPILYFWAVAGSYHLLGVSPLAGRLVSALSGIVLGLSTYGFSLHYVGKKEAAIAALIFVSFPLACAIGHMSLTDMPLAALMGIALQALFHYEKSRKISACIIAYLALALAFLCKGPIAVIIVGIIYGLYLLLTSSPLNTLPKRILQAKPFWGLLIIFLVNLPWYTMAAIGTNGAFLREFFITQNFGRMVGVVNHQQPFWFYVPVLLGGLFPWSLLAILLSLPLLTKSAALGLKGKIQKLWADRGSLNDRTAYLSFNAIWAVFVIVLFSVIKTKLPTYVLPGLPPLALLAAAAVANIENKQSKTLIILGALITATMIGALLAPAATKDWLSVFLMKEYLIFYGGLIAAITFTVLAWRGQSKKALSFLLASAITLTALLVPLGHIAFYEHRQEPFERLIEKIQNAKADIATVVVEAPSLSYFLHRRVEPLKDRAEGNAYLAGGHKPHYLLVPREIMESLDWFERPPVELGKTKNGKWTLYALD